MKSLRDNDRLTSEVFNEKRQGQKEGDPRQTFKLIHPEGPPRRVGRTGCRRS